MDKEQWSVRLQAETAAARQLLAEHLPQLRHRLSEQGINVQNLEILLGNEGSDAAAQDSRHGWSRSRNSWPRATSSSAGGTEDEPAGSVAHLPSSAGWIDLWV